MKKEADNSFGVAGVVLSIMSIVFMGSPLAGLALGITALVFSNKQRKYASNQWSKSGRVLAIIGIVLSALLAIASIYYLAQHPDFLSQAGYSP
ncbi:hypothetical protein KW805_04930 [Candidatus Pacearchaeota archaeon]|nr:hypothetical protein [Candidatus Pacearchaeota archaeon]